VIVEVTGVVADATTPPGTIARKVPTRQNISLPRGEPLTIRLSVLGQDGAAYSLEEVASIKLGLRKFLDDEEPLFTKTATITEEDDEDETVGMAEIAVDADDTLELDEYTAYAYDIQLDDGTARYQIVPHSLLKIVPIVNRADE